MKGTALPLLSNTIALIALVSFFGWARLFAQRAAVILGPLFEWAFWKVMFQTWSASAATVLALFALRWLSTKAFRTSVAIAGESVRGPVGDGRVDPGRATCLRLSRGIKARFDTLFFPCERRTRLIAVACRRRRGPVSPAHHPAVTCWLGGVEREAPPPAQPAPEPRTASDLSFSLTPDLHMSTLLPPSLRTTQRARPTAWPPPRPSATGPISPCGCDA